MDARRVMPLELKDGFEWVAPRVRWSVMHCIKYWKGQ